MHRKVARVLVPLAFLSLIGVAQARVTQAQGFNTLEIDRFVQESMKRHSVPGASLALVMDGKVVYTKGYGVRDTKTNTAVDANTLFAIGSVSKSFTSLGAMQLVDAGKLSLSTKVNAVLPDLKFSDPSKGNQLNLQNLLSHTSGLPRADDLWYFDKNIKTRADMLGTVAKIGFNKPIGTDWQYCNQNFVIAGAMLEKTTGKSWEEYTKQKIFAPLGMTRSVFEPNDAVKDGNYAQGFTNGLNGVETVPAFDRFVIAGPAGSIISSAADMGNYAAFQLSKGVWNGKRVVSKNALETMHSTQVEIDGFPAATPGLAFPSYGLGWFNEEFRGLNMVEHGGNIDGFTAEVQLVPAKRLGIVILANLNDANDFTNDVRLGITERVLGLNPLTTFKPSALNAQLEAAKTFKADLEVLKSLEGKYALITGDTLEIQLKDGQLNATQSGQTFPMIASSKTEFILNAAGSLISLEFNTDANGVIWLSQEGQVVGARFSTDSTEVVSRDFIDPTKSFKFVVPIDLRFVNQIGNVSAFASVKFSAGVSFLTVSARGSLEETVSLELQKANPGFLQKPDNVRELPAINGVIWTQYLYKLPNDEILIVLGTQKANTAFLIAAQISIANLNAFTPTINELLLSFKILI